MPSMKRLNKSRRLVAFFLLLIFLVNSFPSSVSARTFLNSAEVKQVVYANMTKITNRVTTYTNQRGVFNNLRNIMISSLWVKFINENTEVEFSKDELEYYQNTLMTKVKDFNATAEDGRDYIKVQLPEVTEAYSSGYFKSLVDTVSTYLNTYYSKLKSEYDALEDENAKSKYLTDLNLTILSSYEILVRTSQDYDYMKSLTTNQSSPVNFDGEIIPLSNLLINADYKFIYDQAISQIEKGVNVGGEIKLTDADDIIGKFTAVDDSGQALNKVNEAYLAIIASSSIYKPFDSKVGNDDFTNVLNYLTDNDQEVLDAYNSICLLKKPLYYVDYKGYSDNNYPTRDNTNLLGTASRATLGKVIELTRGKTEGALVSIKGKFEISEDSDTYVASQKNNIGNVTNNGNVGDYIDLNNQNNSNSGNNSDEESNGNNSNNSNGNNNSNNSGNTNGNNSGNTNGNNSNNSGNGNNSGNSNVNNNSNTNSNSSGEKLEYVDNTGKEKEVELSETIADTSSYTSPYLTFSRYGMSGINFILMNNIFSEGNSLIDLDDNAFYNKSLYITPFGDIVTSDNTVIIPASANSTLYTQSSNLVYNPFTDAFMDNYPTIFSIKDFQVSSKDVGKVAIYVGDKDLDAIESIKEKYLVDSSSLPDIDAFEIKGENKIGKTFFLNNDTINPIDTGIFDPLTGEKYNVFQPVKKEFGFWKKGMILSDPNLYSINTNIISTESLSVPLYPYTNATGNEKFLRNRFIAQSFYASLVTQNDGSDDGGDNGRFDTKFLKEMLTELINGKSSVIGYEKGVYNEQALAGNDGSIFSVVSNFFKWISDNIIELFGAAPGVLGLRSATQDVFMGRFLYYSMKALPFLSIILVLVMLSLYARNRFNIIYSIFGTTMGVLGLFILIYLAPKYLADITNFLPNNGSNRLAFDSLLLRQEVLREKTTVEASYSDFGKFGLAESSVTLYSFKDDQLEDVCKDYGQDLESIMSGGSFVIDEDSGLFVQGSKLKISLDKILNGISITTKSNTDSNVTVFELQREEYVKSVLNYYIPYDVIIDGLIGKLNNLSKVYLLTRNQLPYPNNIRKDAFFMDSYVRSPIFVSPRDPKEADKDMSDDTLQLLEAYFMKQKELGNEDWLGLYDSLSKYIHDGGVRSTLWYQTMEQNHYFDEQHGSKLIANLIGYVNNNTKEFLLKNIDKLPYISDETLVEVTSLYATMLFNTQVSQFGNKLYPERINYEELSVVDTLRPIFTKDYNKFSEKSRDLVQYVYSEYGFLGNLSLALTVLTQGITSLILTYAIFIMYLLLILFILIRLVIKKDSMRDAVFGFLKLYSVLVGVYFVNVLGLQILNKFDSSALSLFFALILSSIVCGMSTSVVFYTITGFANLDFSNGNAFKGILKGLDKMSFGLLSGAFKSTTGKIEKLFSKSLDVASQRNSLDRNVNNIDIAYSRYEDSSRVDDYIKGRYSQYDSTDDFYNRSHHRYGRAERMKRRVEIDIEDDGDFLY